MLEGIQVFIQIVESGSFSKAGVALQLATSSVTRQLDKLEAELGVKLFKRSTRSLSLTEDGQRFLSQASELLQQAQQLKQSFNQQQPSKGLLKISVFESFGRINLAPKLKDFLNQYPDVDVDISLDNKMVDLTKDNIDVAIRIGVPQDSNLKARRLMVYESCLVASPEYFKKYGKPAHPTQLSQHSCLSVGSRKMRKSWFFKQDNASEAIKVPVSGRVSSVGASPLIQAACDGFGIMQLSKWAIQAQLEKGELETCLEDWKSSVLEHQQLEVYAVYHSDNQHNRVLQAFMRFLAQQYPL